MKKSCSDFCAKFVLEFSDADCPNLALDIFEESKKSIFGVSFCKNSQK